MRIALLADVSMAEVIGGAERVLCEQAKGLSRRGHCVHVLTRLRPEHRVPVETIDGVTEWRYPFRTGSLASAAKSIGIDCRRAWLRLARGHDIQAAICHQPFSALCLHSTLRPCPSLYVCHSLSFEEFRMRSPLPAYGLTRISHHFKSGINRYCEKAVLQGSHHILVLSDYTREKLRRIHGLVDSRISTVPAGVDLERFRPESNKAIVRRELGLPDDKIILFTVRNLVARMGLESIVTAMGQLRHREPRAILVIGGEGPLKSRLTDAIRAGGLARSVRLEGFIAEDRLPLYYQAADLFVLPTVDLEGFGLVTLEAMASGLPVVGTPVGGTVEILGRFDHGYLFKDPSPEAMAALIAEKCRIIRETPERWQAAGASCRHFVESRYSWSCHLDRLEQLVTRCVETRASRRQ